MARSLDPSDVTRARLGTLENFRKFLEVAPFKDRAKFDGH